MAALSKRRTYRVFLIYVLILLFHVQHSPIIMHTSDRKHYIDDSPLILNN